MNKIKLELFADYFQLYLMDEEADDDTSDIWTNQALDLKLAIKQCTVAVGTYRNVDVLFEVEVTQTEPNVDLKDWDHAALGFFEVKSGKCVIYGCSDYLPDAARINVSPGKYAVLSLAKGLDTITEEWVDADDLYKVFIWPSDSKVYKSLKTYEIT